MLGGTVLQEVLKSVTSDVNEPMEKSVTLCLGSKPIHLHGSWSWEMQSPAVYCSDVMSFPEDFVGTKGIIHPDDLPKLNAALSLMEDKDLVRLDFHIITTYGEVKTISGQRVSIEEPKQQLIEPVPGKEPWEEFLQQLAEQKENDFLKLRNELTEYTERVHGIGSWLINKQTGEAWYSDNVFRIHGLAPQSLNAHANTFNHFIHNEDHVTVSDAFEKSYEHHLPLHIEYRIMLADEQVRTVQQITRWLYAPNGQEILSGIIRDVTEVRVIADELLAAQSYTFLHQQLLKFSELQSSTGYWYMDLASRKISYSDNYLRIYGIKQFVLPSYNSFLNLVHVEDRDKVRSLMDKMYNEHVLPETEYRIIRPDGKTRYLKQSGKLFVSANNELIMFGLVQDVSLQKALDKKILELSETIGLNNTVMEITESVAETSFFVWLQDGYMHWSDGFYRMLGYKPGAVEALPRFLHKSIHPSDLKTFTDAESLVLNQQMHDDIVVRFISRAGTRLVKISFRHISYGKEAVLAVVHDISRQNLLEKELADHKIFSELVQESVHDGIIFTNTDNIITHWNHVAEEKTGIKKEDALHQNLFDVLPRLSQEVFMSRLNAALRGEENSSLRIENAYLRQAHNFWLWPLKNEKGEVTGVLHIVYDVSKQLQMQQQLSERLNFIENLVESSIDRIVVLDRFMNYLYWNKKAEEYYAISKERVLGKNILEVFPSFRNNTSYNEFRRVLKGDTVYLPPVSSKESDEYFETHLIPVKNESSEVAAVLWIVHDLTEHKKAEEEILQLKAAITQNAPGEHSLSDELKWRSQFLEIMVDSSSNRITVFDANCRFIVWNKRCEEVHGITKDKVIGKTIFEIFPGIENYPVYMNAQERSLKGERVHIPFVEDGFTGAYLELSYVPLKNEAGETYAVLNIMHDVTTFVKNTESLHILNKQLEAKNAELEQKNEEITNFAFVASHDMKEPLRKIHTFSDWLRETESEWLSQQGKTVLEKMNASVQRMEVLIDDILVLTKIHSDRHRTEEVDLDKILCQVKDEMTERIAQTSTVIEAKKLPVIKGNANQVFYLFKNLLSNAIKFQKAGSIPQIIISSEIVNGSEVNLNEPREEYLKISFSDNGFGFDQKYEKKIFQVFQRLHGKQEFEGTGIGLAICKKIMENHEGLIDVKSELGKGSVFNCFFPLH